MVGAAIRWLRARRVELLVAGILTPAVALAQFSATVDSTAISEQETVQLTLRWEGGDPGGQPDLSPLERDFAIIGAPQRSSQWSISTVNGVSQSRATTTWTATLQPRRSGTLVIPAVRYLGEASAPITVSVSRASEADRARMRQLAFLVTSIDREQVYVQEQVIYTQKFYTRYSYEGELPEQPTFAHALVKPLGEPRDYRTVASGIEYLVREWRYALFPQRSGELTIPPLTLNGAVRTRGGGLFSLGQSRRVQTRSEGHRVVVNPIPAGFTGDTWIPARSLNLAQSWSGTPPTFTVGEPVNRTVTIDAAGVPLSSLPQLRQDPLDIARVYSDPPDGTETFGDEGIASRQSVTFGIVPTAEGRIEFPEIRIEWWNTGSDELEVATLPAASFPVAASSAPNRTTVQSNFGEPLPTVSADQPPSAATTSYWPYLSALLALAWALTVLMWLATRRSLARARATQADQSPDREDPAHTEAVLFEELAAHCRSNDAPRARWALLQWARSLWPDERIRNLDDVMRVTKDGDLERVIERLDRVLYAPTGAGSQPDSQADPWQGEELRTAAARIRESRRGSARAVDATIPALNPI